jgi:RNA polymerase sigma-70 factor (ECF subfamily)
VQTERDGTAMTSRTELTDAVADRRQAFATLVDRELDAAYRLAGVILGDPFEAEDATHDAVVAAWRHYASLNDPARFRAWLQRILVNTCRDRLRRRRRQPSVEIDLSNLRTTGDSYREVDDRVALDGAFDALSVDQRLVIVLRFYGDLTVHQIAYRLGVPAGTVKSRLHTATAKLNQALADEREDLR